MPVTIQPDDLKQPKGELDAAYFPTGNMDAYLTGWYEEGKAIIEARDDVENDDAALTAYVYKRAYSYLATYWNTLATTTTIAGQITRTVNKEQVAYFAALADKWSDAYFVLVPPIVPDDPTPTVVYAGVSTPVGNIATW